MPFRDQRPLARETVLAIVDLCRDAADVILAHYDAAGDAAARGGAMIVRKKADHSPLTEADLASHRVLEEGLRRLTPQLPLLSEESDAQALRQRRQWSRLWMLDPLDGTREFIERSGEFTINLALLDAGRPAFGLIHEPIEGRTHVGIPGQGAWSATRIGGALRWEAARTRRLAERECVVLSSRRHRNPRLEATLEFLAARYRVERRNRGSALKFCELAAGRGDCYPRFSPCSEWDVAAGDALVCAAGGQVLGADGAPLRYNAGDTLLSPHFLAVGDAEAPPWKALLARLAANHPGA